MSSLTPFQFDTSGYGTRDPFKRFMDNSGIMNIPSMLTPGWGGNTSMDARGIADRQIHNYEQKHFLHTDIVEHKDCFCIHIDCPGVLGDDLEVVITEHTVTVSGIRKPCYSEGDRMLRGETYTGDFHRTVRLPKHALDDGATVSHANGVLCITLKKDYGVSGASHRRKLEIKHDPSEGSSSVRMDTGNGHSVQKRS